MTARIEIVKACAICGALFTVKPSTWHAIVTCSKECSAKKRSIVSTGRLVTWGDAISKALTGKKRAWSPPKEYRDRMRELAFMRGFGGKNKGTKASAETREKMSKAHRGHKRGGWKLSIALRRKMSEARKGDKTHLWKGGITKQNQAIRSSFDYKLWRESVFRRDDFTCQLCRKRGGALHADHIKPFSTFPELRLALDNGRTLCVPCHKSTPTYLNSRACKDEALVKRAP